jgi:hypothetical protein
MFSVGFIELNNISDNSIFQPIKAYEMFDDDYISDELLLYIVVQCENQQVSEKDPIHCG